MSDTADLLEVLQSDVFAVLKNTPGLSTLNILADNAGDIEARVIKSMGALTSIGGKNGLSIVVLRPEVTQAESNMPGPPLTLKVEVQCIEHVLFNRAAATGTLVRSSQAALMVLRALGLCGLGSRLLYADKDPIQPVPVKPGYVSDAVTVYCKVAGLEPAAKPLAVQAEMAGILRFMAPGIDDMLIKVYGSRWTSTGTVTALAVAGDYYNAQLNEGPWFIEHFLDGDFVELFTSTGNGTEASPDLAPWPAGVSVSTTAVASLSLTCATAASTIRYTTDGSFPSPTATLYTAPISGLQAGTIVRAAAYVTGMAPSDVTEILITE